MGVGLNYSSPDGANLCRDPHCSRNPNTTTRIMMKLRKEPHDFTCCSMPSHQERRPKPPIALISAARLGRDASEKGPRPQPSFRGQPLIGKVPLLLLFLAEHMY